MCCRVGRRFLTFLLIISIFLTSSYCIAFAADPDVQTDPDVLLEDGMRYLLGDGVDQDLLKGITMIAQAANEGSARAMIQVGIMYKTGLGKLLSEDFVDGTAADCALSWYIKAAESGEREAAAAIISSDAFTYFLGSEDGSIPEDDATALKYFEKAAEYGDPEAINMMAAFFTYGFGVEHDPDKALELSSQLADEGNAEALLSMEENAYAYYAGTKDGIDINFATAFQYYLKLTEYGNERAMYNVALLYEFGLGTPTDHEKALEWLTKAQEAGYEPASVMLTQLTNNN